MPSLARSITAVLIAGAVVFGFAGAADAGPVNSYAQKNLVSNQGSGAAHTDAHLVNPWGIAFNPFAFVWISNNGTDTATLYDGAGVPSPQGVPLVVSISAKAPTGIVFSGSPTDFTLKQGSQPVPTPVPVRHGIRIGRRLGAVHQPDGNDHRVYQQGRRHIQGRCDLGHRSQPVPLAGC